MFNPRARISSRAEHDRLLRDRAVAEAAALFRVHGADAIYAVSLSLIEERKNADERRHDRLVIVELERLDRLHRNGAGSATALVVWKPPLFSMARFKGLFRKRRGLRLR